MRQYSQTPYGSRTYREPTKQQRLEAIAVLEHMIGILMQDTIVDEVVLDSWANGFNSVDLIIEANKPPQEVHMPMLKGTTYQITLKHTEEDNYVL